MSGKINFQKIGSVFLVIAIVFGATGFSPQEAKAKICEVRDKKSGQVLGQADTEEEAKNLAATYPADPSGLQVSCKDEKEDNPTKSCVAKAGEDILLGMAATVLDVALDKPVSLIKEGVKKGIKTGLKAIGGFLGGLVGNPEGGAKAGEVVGDGLIGEEPKPVKEVGQVKNDTAIIKIRSCVKELKDVVLRKGLERTKKRLLDSLVDDTRNWILNGGQPRFIRDFKGFLGDNLSAAVGDVIVDVGAANLCLPQQRQFLNQALGTADKTVLPRFSERISCTIGDVTKNVEAFYRDFRNGGFSAYQALLEPQNNKYGQLVMVLDEIQQRKAESEEAAKLEATANQGYLGVKQCVSYRMKDNESGKTQKGITDPLEISKYQAEPSKYELTCEREEITLPGKSVGAQFDNAIAADLSKAINATDLSPYTKALIDAGITRLINGKNKGVLGMEPSRSGQGLPPKPIAQAQDEITKDTTLSEKEKEAKLEQLANLAAAGEEYERAANYAQKIKEDNISNTKRIRADLDVLVKKIDAVLPFRVEVLKQIDELKKCQIANRVNFDGALGVGNAQACPNTEEDNVTFTDLDKVFANDRETIKNFDGQLLKYMDLMNEDQLSEERMIELATNIDGIDNQVKQLGIAYDNFKKELEYEIRSKKDEIALCQSNNKQEPYTCNLDPEEIKKLLLKRL